MKSMTGYGSARKSNNKNEIEINLRAVNGRYLDIRLHMPKQYHAFESEIKKSVGDVIKRGTVDVYINRNSKVGQELSVSVNPHAIKTWMKAFREINRHSKVEMNLGLKDILECDGVINLKEQNNVTKAEKSQLLSTLKLAIKACQAERLREGRALKIDLKKHLDQIQVTSKKMKDLRLEANRELKKKYEGKLKTWKEQNMDHARLSQELMFLLDKADINEELSRLVEHIRSCGQLVNQPAAKGKKLDFYSQELLREINTIGSKSQISKLTELVVDAKSAIERFREQVQNIE